MNADARKISFPAGPLLGILLIGILLLSALLYYRAIKIQRFLEPALAITEPRIKFNQSIKALLEKEFGKSESSGVRFRGGSIIVNQSLLFALPRRMVATVPPAIAKLGRVFAAALDDPGIREHISLIIVSSPLYLGANPENQELSFFRHDFSGMVLNSLFSVEPKLRSSYESYFTATALPQRGKDETDVVEFRIVPTERLHIDALEKLEKYIY